MYRLCGLLLSGQVVVAAVVVTPLMGLGVNPAVAVVAGDMLKDILM
jgi:hypothetical protein